MESKEECIDQCMQELREEYPFLWEEESLFFMQDLYEFLERYFF